jgi:hypothetical protein
MMEVFFILWWYDEFHFSINSAGLLEDPVKKVRNFGDIFLGKPEFNAVNIFGG